MNAIGSAPAAEAERRRVACLASFAILDTPPEEAYDRITRLARTVFDVPIAAVSFVDAARQWFKSRPGLDVAETPRRIAFCDHAIRSRDIMVVRDATRDARFRDNPLVTGEPGIRFYAGAPLVTSDGHPLGVVCVIDRRPRRPTAIQLRTLADLAALVMDELELRRALSLRDSAETALAEREALLRTVMDAMPGTINVKDRDGRFLYVNAFQASYFGLTPDRIIGTKGEAMLAEPDYDARLAAVEAEVWRTGQPSGFIEQAYRKPGEPVSIWAESKTPVLGADGAIRCIVGIAIDITELKNTRTAYQDAAGQLQSLADASPALLFMVDAEDRHVFQNQAWLDFFGVAAHDAARLVCHDAMHPDDRDRITAAYRAAFTARRPYEFEHRLRRRDGSWRWMREVGAPRFDASGAFIGYAGVCIDISDQKSAEDVRRETERKLISLAESAPAHIWLVDRDARVELVNHEARAFLGAPGDDRIHQAWADAIHPDDRDRILGAERSARRDGSAYQLEYRLRRHDGVFRWIAETLRPRFDAEGAHVGYASVSIDVTGRREAEASERDAVSRLKALADTTPAQLWQLDATGRVTLVNDEARTFYGLANADDATRIWDAVVHREDLERIRTAFKACVDTHAPLREEYRVQRHDGVYRWIVESGQPSYDANGTYIGYTGAALDVTEQRWAEDEARKGAERLEVALAGADLGLWDIDVPAMTLTLDRRWHKSLSVPGDRITMPLDAWFDHVHPDDRAAVRGRLDAHLSGASPEYEPLFRVRATDGTWRWLVAYGQVSERAPDGKPLRMTGIDRDITRQREAELKAREADQVLRSLADAMPTHVNLTDRDQVIVFVNREYREFHGLAEGQPIGKPWYETVHPDDLGPAEEEFQARWKERRPYRIEYRNRRRDGAFRWFKEEGVPCFDSHGAFTGYACTAVDITDVKDAANEIAHGRAMLQAIIDALPTHIALRDLDGRYVMANRAATTWWDDGTTAASVVGRSPYDVHAPDIARQVLETDAEAVAHGTTVGPFERSSDDARGRTHHWLTYRVPIRDASGAITHILGTAHDVSELKRAQHEAERTRNLLRLVIDTVPANVVLRDRQGRYTLANAPCAAMFGVTPDEVVGRRPHDFLPATMADTLVGYDDAVFSSDVDAPPSEETYDYPDGATRTWRVHRRAMRSESGTIDQVLTVGYDVTALKRADEDVRRNRNLLRVAIDAMPANIALRDDQGHYVLVNARLAAQFGVAPDAMIGRTPRDYYASDEAERMLNQDRRIFENALDAATADLAFDGPDGSKRYWQVHRRAVRDDTGTVRQVLNVGFDVTGLRMADEAVRRSQAFLREIMDALPIGVSVRAPDGRFTFMNATEGRWFGIDPATAVGRAVADVPFLPSKDATERHRQAVETGEPVGPFYESFPSADGVHRTWLVTRVPRRGPDGAVAYVITVGLDVTDQRQLEQRLAQAEKMQAIGQLTGGVAHDFNNLLAIVVGNVELAIEGVADDATRTRLATALAAALRGGDLTQRLLAFARRKPLEPTVIDVARALDGMTGLMRHALGDGVAVSLNLAPDVPAIRVDLAQFETAILNLAINARHAMEQGGSLTIAAERVHVGGGPNGPEALGPGAYARIRVTDTGRGIEPHHLAKVFEPFFTTKETGKGTGLGLSMVYGFVRESGGDVTIDSTPGYGTAVTILLPACDDRASATTQPSDSAAARGRGESVLLVEDEPELLAFAAQTLGALGYRVVQAKDGAAALQALAGLERLDILVTDVMLPGGLDGRELGRIVRRRWPGTPTLLVTGMAHAGAGQPADLAPGEALLSKPFRRAQFAAAVRRALDARSLAAAS